MVDNNSDMRIHLLIVVEEFTRFKLAEFVFDAEFVTDVFLYYVEFVTATGCVVLEVKVELIYSCVSGY
ncbi:hypothetical protein Fmac_011750 [Flemingia macrophylla]|uniref:Uncharacterized protein n=1 Tax=Flemingia macrophylla TaxID=520843 RepID=A0ABD1MNB7_9FABA